MIMMTERRGKKGCENMKVLVDTNIILDVLCRRPEFYEDSAKVFKLCEVRKVTGVVSALSIPSIVFIMKKELDAKRIREVLDMLSLIFMIAELKNEDLKRASFMNFKNYEDAVQSACASRVRADYIITRNSRDFMDSGVTAVKPAEFLDGFQF